MKKSICVLLAVTVWALLPLTASAYENGENVIVSVPNEEMKIALTFDDGPHYKYTAEILDILEEYGVKATFFVIGTNVSDHPELVERELAEGHEVENHTYDHVYLKKISEEEIFSEVSDNESIIAGITDYSTHFVRPPGGLYDDRLMPIVDRLGYKIVLWSVDTCDWKRPPSESIAANVINTVKSGDIILMHDFICGVSPTPDALRIIIPSLLEKGFSFVTVSELARCRDK